VDAGDYTGDDTTPGRMQTEALLEGMKALEYRIANLSLRELGHGHEAFLRRKAAAGIDLISANLVWQDTGEPIAPATAVRKVTLREGAKVREVRLGFIGLTKLNPAFQMDGPAGRRIVTLDPFAAAEKQVPALRKKADVIVALVALDLEEARQLPKRVKDIDLILGGDPTPGRGAMQTRADDFPEDTKIGRSRIFYIADQGKNLGEVRLFFNAEKGIAATQRSLVALTRDWPDDPALARLMETTKVAVNEFNRAQAEKSSPFAAGSRVAPADTYTGSERCVACHEQAFAVWARSGHAHAFETLVRASQDFNPRCVGCHTIGFGSATGFVNRAATPGLINVGCEACHGPSSRHPETVQAGYGRTDTGFCMTCHTGENSPDYNPAEYVPKVRHWGEPQAAR
jgi:hypothetical protein